MITFFNWFTKITGYPVQKICFRTKIYYSNKKVQSRRIKDKAIIISNHTSVYDYAVLLFVFFSRTLRYQMAEVLYRKKPLALLLKLLGGIYVDRESGDFSFLEKSEEVLNGGGIVGVFPESRIPKKDEEKPLPFKTSVVQLALSSGAKIIPVYTNGSYFSLKRARVIIGTPVDVESLVDDKLTRKENADLIAKKLREEIIKLKEELNEKEKR